MSERTALLAYIERAAGRIGPAWPLDQAVAVNPLQGYEDQPFEEAVLAGAELFGGRSLPDSRWGQQALAEGRIDRDLAPAVGQAEAAAESPASGSRRPHSAVNRLVVKWLAAFLDRGEATWPMPQRELGFYRAWRRVARFDPEIPRRRELAALPDDPLDALVTLMGPVAYRDRTAVLRAHLAALPGWAGYIKWRAGNQHDPWQRAHPVTLADYLAVRLALAERLGEATPPAYPRPAHAETGLSWLYALEATYRRRLLAALATGRDAVQRLSAPAAEPRAQLVFCIDVRSEVFRRHLEAVGPYETLGFAGFFGVPMAHRGLVDARARPACPVLVDPEIEIPDVPAPGAADTCHHHRAGHSFLQRAKKVLAGLKSTPGASFPFVEAAGPVYGLAMVAQTLAPTSWHRLLAWLDARVRPAAPTRPGLDQARPTGQQDATGMSHAAQLYYGEASLRLMGLTQGFAETIVFCGHAAEAVNNPYLAGLHCGACAGRPGGPNAAVLAAILNRPEIRSDLAERGIAIPDTTVFLAGEHNTTTDAVTVSGPERVGAEAWPAAAEQLQSDLAIAGERARAERRGHLPGIGEPERRSKDWAQVRPEWGLAGNAAIIVGPRAATAHANLQGRTFLHSYDWRGDPDGALLTVILSAPVIVAQWINAQYFFSSLDPVIYGGGSKVTQTVVGALGVMQGNGSDLMTGLPVQSVRAASDRLYHEPVRLTVVVYAPHEKVATALQASRVCSKLLENGWLKLLAIDPETGATAWRSRDGRWQPDEAAPAWAALADQRGDEPATA